VSPSLRCTEGALQGQLIEIESELTLGRGMSGIANLGGDSQLSRRHARLYVDAGQLHVEDLGSTNGTFVNDRRLTAPQRLQTGDRVRCGKTRLEVAVDAAAQIAPPVPVEQATRTAAPRSRTADSTRAPAGGARLEVVGGALQGESIPLSAQLSIGRGFGEPGALGGDRRLSRRHARIARGPDGAYTIEDTGSTNGTNLNGQRLQGSQLLREGDEIGVGSSRLIARGMSQSAPVIDDSFDRNSPGYDEPVTAPRARPVEPVTAPRAAPPPVPGPAAAPPPFPGPAAAPAPAPVPVGAVSGARTAAPGQLFVPQGATSTRLGSRRLVAVFASVFVLSGLIGLAVVLLVAPPGSRTCPNGFVCEKPLTAPALVSQHTFRGSLGWKAEFDPSTFTPLTESVAANTLSLRESNEQDHRFGLSPNSQIIGIDVRAFPSSQVGAVAAMKSMAAKLSSGLIGATTARNADQMFTHPALGIHAGVGEVLVGNQRTPQGPGHLLKVAALAATSGSVTVVCGVIYGVLPGSNQSSDPDKPLDQLGDQIIDRVRFPTDDGGT
jgi:pSer/pThr/pTyr-binding forkhead associated (FHA) protein